MEGAHCEMLHHVTQVRMMAAGPFGIPGEPGIGKDWEGVSSFSKEGRCVMPFCQILAPN